jgi:hypothetical protein
MGGIVAGEGGPFVIDAAPEVIPGIEGINFTDILARGASVSEKIVMSVDGTREGLSSFPSLTSVQWRNAAARGTE